MIDYHLIIISHYSVRVSINDWVSFDYYFSLLCESIYWWLIIIWLLFLITLWEYLLMIDYHLIIISTLNEYVFNIIIFDRRCV